MTNVSIGLIVVLVGLALVVGMNSSGPSGFSSPAPLAASAPTRVTVPSISAESSLVPTGLKQDEVLQGALGLRADAGVVVEPESDAGQGRGRASSSVMSTAAASRGSSRT